MKKALVFTAAVWAVSGLASPALAAITLDTTISGVTLDFGPTPTNLSDKIKGNGQTSATSPTALTLITDSNNLVDFSSPNYLEQQGGSGFATVSGQGNGGSEQGFANLLIDPQSPANGFTAINFGLKALGNGNHTYYGDIILNLLAGGQVSFENVALQTNGLTHFGISSDDNRIFSSIYFGNLRTVEDNLAGSAKNFESIRQVSISLASAVPEPATWAMMILGIGMVGGAMRTRRAKVTPVYA